MNYSLLWFYVKNFIRILEISYIFELFYLVGVGRNRYVFKSFFILGVIGLVLVEDMRRISDKCFFLLKIFVNLKIINFFWKIVLVCNIIIEKVEYRKKEEIKVKFVEDMRYYLVFINFLLLLRNIIWNFGSYWFFNYFFIFW